MMMGGGGFGQMPFEEKYHVCSVALKSQELEEGGRIVLPPSALAKLTQRDVAYPYFFELSAPGNGRKIHCGVQEFSASEGQAWIPHWMMENLGVEFGNLLTVKSVTLPQCQYVKFRPQSKLFLDITNPKAVLEKTLGAFSALTKGATIRIHYNRKTYDIDVVDLKPRDTGAASIVNADVNVDFEAPSDYVEPTYTPKPIKMPMFDDMEKAEDEEPAGAKSKAFVGTGARPNGKAVSVEPGESAMQVDGPPPVKKDALQWKLRFPRYNGIQPPVKGGPSEDGAGGAGGPGPAAAAGGGRPGTASGFAAFEGAGQRLQ